MSLAERFEAKIVPVTESGCWLWIGTVNNKGYGQLLNDGKLQLAHRLSCELAGRPIPRDKQASHRCDVPCCVNPAHIFAASHAENMADMWAKGRNRGNFQFKKTCLNGHDNWKWRNGRRVCVDCRRGRDRKSRNTDEYRAKHAAYEKRRRAARVS